jgi:endonuclease YncB( thermonuclease family)
MTLLRVRGGAGALRSEGWAPRITTDNTDAESLPPPGERLNHAYTLSIRCTWDRESMPLSFRHSSKNRPGAKIKRKKRVVAVESKLSAPPASAQIRAVKYPPGVLIGCGALLVVGAVVIVSSGLFGLQRPQGPQAASPTAPVAPSLKTAIAARVATLAAGTPTARPFPSATSASPSPTVVLPTLTLTLAPSATLPPSNPWSAQIPEAACIRTDLPQKGIVVGVLDGDTIRVRLEGNENVYSVRYIGVEAPAIGQYYEAISTGKNADLVLFKQATLVRDLTDTDPQGTLLRYVMVEGKFVNYELIAGGYAQSISSAPDTACSASFQAAQYAAQSHKLGLWSAPAYLIPFSPTP